MGKQRNMTFLKSFVFIYFCGGISCKVLLPNDGFKFNCGADICIYPLQYCDVANDGICKYCNEDLCNTEDVPQQCYTACSGKYIYNLKIIINLITEGYLIRSKCLPPF